MIYPDDYVNKIICGDCLDVMSNIPSQSIGLIVTSPPYNVGIKYDNHNDSMTLENYEFWLNKKLEECIRVLVDGGHLIIQVANTGRNPYLHLSGMIAYLLRNKIRTVGEIIWVKFPTGATSWGSWMSPNSPCIRDEHEYILVFRKEGTRYGESDIEKQEFMDWTKSIWHINPSSRVLPHPAPYPEELVRRIIKLFSFKNEIVLDPFSGSGTTAVACKKLGRRYIGIDISASYCGIAERRLSQDYLFV